MEGEGKNINKLSAYSKRALNPYLIFLPLFLFVHSCSTFTPELLTFSDDKDRIIEDVLKRGRVYTLDPEDEEALVSLLKDPDPEVRLTVLKIMEKNPSQSIYDAILEATLDDEESVSDEAFRILFDQWDQAYKAVVRGLDSDSVSLLLSSINAVSRKKASGEADYLLTLFSDPREVVRSAASRTFAALGDFSNPWFQVLLVSLDSNVRLTAVQTLPRFHDPLMVPVLIPYVKDPENKIRSAALFGLSEYDVDALPFLHVTLLNSSDDELRLSLLQIVEGILDSRSVSVLLDMLEDENERIALKSVEILVRLGADAVVPSLLERMEGLSPEALIHSFSIAEKFQDLRLLPVLSGNFNHSDPKVAEKAVAVIQAYGDSASDYLIDQLDDGNPLQSVSLEILVQLKEPDLVYDEARGEYRTDNIFLLFESLTQDSLLSFLSSLPLPSRIVSSLWSLYDIDSNVLIFKNTGYAARYEEYPYFYYFREWEQYLLNAEASRLGAFQYQQKFFNTGDESWLTEARILRNTADWYDRGAENAFKRAVSAGRNASEEEKQVCLDYLESRRALVSRWRNLTSDIQKMARLVFLRNSLDIEALAGEYDFFRSLPPKSIPSPENI